MRKAWQDFKNKQKKIERDCYIVDLVQNPSEILDK